MVLGVCRLVLADTVEAEDAMQQTFLSAYRSILGGSEPQRPAAWLATIARNECLDRIRARTREPVAERVSGDTRGTPDALNAAISREDLRVLGRTIKELPAQQREALLLHEFHGLPYRDVAAAIGVSESAIASLLFRARARLRSVLHRAYAMLPMPALWNGASHLFAPGSGTNLTALPVVAKLGTAAVAVGLTAGAAIVVAHDVTTHHRPLPSASVHHSVASPAAQAPKQGLRPARLVTSLPTGSRSAVVPRTGRAPSHARPPATTVHTAHHVMPVTTKHAHERPTPPASVPQRPPPGKSSSSGEGTNAAAAHRPSIRNSPPDSGVKDTHSQTRSSDATPLPKKSAKPSATPNSIKQAPPTGRSLDGHNGVSAQGNPGAHQHPDGPPADSHQPSAAESNPDVEHGADSSNILAKHEGTDDHGPKAAEER
jgi:RNA polymerase sigma factor (sigma-70 family)